MGQIRHTSIKSRIYHKQGCRYAKNIKSENFIKMEKKDAMRNGLRPCKCCNSLRFIWHAEQNAVIKYKDKGVECRLSGDIIYAKTAIGCWKLKYYTEEEKLRMFHFNRPAKNIDFDHPENEPFHVQEDHEYDGSILGCLRYIRKHDDFRAAVINNVDMGQLNKKGQRTYKRILKRREARRLDKLLEQVGRELNGQSGQQDRLKAM